MRVVAGAGAGGCEHGGDDLLLSICLRTKPRPDAAAAAQTITVTAGAAAGAAVTAISPITQSAISHDGRQQQQRPGSDSAHGGRTR